MRILLASLITLLAIGCAQQPNGSRYAHQHDHAPEHIPDLGEIKDAQPKYEPLSLQGNKHYQVLGKHYQVLPRQTTFEEHGYASWYGNKFHGHLTSNGETYDMFTMTAAHKNLPLPSYVKVTNLENNQTAIVRVNDRGPFHEGRIIDLSYAAAKKIGMLQKGTAKVRINVIDTSKGFDVVNKKAFYLQVLASNQQSRVTQLLDQLNSMAIKARTVEQYGLTKVQVGPYAEAHLAKASLEKLANIGISDGYVISEAVK